MAGLSFYVGGQRADINLIQVDENLGKQDIGVRLLRAAASHMKDFGVTELYSGNLSRHALGLRVKVFGPDSMKFFYTDEHRRLGIRGPDPANIAEAQAAMDAAYAGIGKTSWSLANTPATFAAYIDLTTIDTSDWERPLKAEVTDNRVVYLEDTE